VAEAIHSSVRFRGLRRALTPSPAVAHAIRFGVAVSAAIWLGKAPGLVENNATWILITVLVLMQPTTGGFLLKGLMRALGTVAAAFTAIGLFGLFAQDPPLLMAGFFLVQALGAYGFSGQRYPYAWMVWAFTTAIVLAPALAGSGAVETIAFQRASMVGIGILLVLLVDALFWPVRAETSLRQSLASRARQLGEALGSAVAPTPGPGGVAPQALESGALAKQIPLVAAARTELGVSRATADALQHVAMLLGILAARARVLADPVSLPPEVPVQGGGIDATLTELAGRIEAALAEVADALLASRAPASFADELEQQTLRLEAELDRVGRGVPGAAALAGRVADLRDLVAVLGTLQATLSSRGVYATASRAGAWREFRPDPARVKIALRCGIAVIAAFLVLLVLDWPQNALVAPIALIAAPTTRGAARQTLTGFAVFLGLGWLLADGISVYVAPQIGRAPLALVVPFAVAAVLAYLGATRPKLALAPVLVGLVALLSVFGGIGPPMDVYGPYSTVCYMAVGLGAGWVASRLLWPATAAGLFRQRVAAQLALCADAVRGARDAGDAERRRRLAPLLRGFAAQAVQLGPLHQQALQEPVERALDPSRREKILELATDLVDAVLGDRPGAAEPLLERGGAPLRPLLEALRREDETLLESMQAAVETMRGDAVVRGSDLSAAHQAVEERLREVSSSPDAIPDLTDEERRRLLVEFDSRRRLVLRQLALEDWLAVWRTAEQEGQVSQVTTSSGS
jgi:uncharacterized membrane protein YccC